MAGLALASLMNDDKAFAQDAALDGGQCSAVFPGAFEPKQPHFKPRAKSVISLFMSGGPSQVDTFDYKPALPKYAGVPLEDLIGENSPSGRVCPVRLCQVLSNLSSTARAACGCQNFFRTWPNRLMTLLLSSRYMGVPMITFSLPMKCRPDRLGWVSRALGVG